MIWRILFAVCLGCSLTVLAQDPKPPSPAAPAAAPSTGAWSIKTFDLKYIDPEQVRNVFAGQSYVMEANRDLKLLTARGSVAFLKEVGDTIKRLDVPPPIPPNAEITVYLLAAAPEGPAGTALPPELKLLAKELPAKVADLQMLRSRAGLPAETTAVQPAPASPAVSLFRVRVDSTSVNPGAKGDVVSLNGLKVWINLPSPDPAASKTPKAQPDVAADIDVTPNLPVVVARIGVDKPLAVVVRVVVVK